MHEDVTIHVGQTVIVYGNRMIVTGIDLSASVDGMSMKIVGCDPETANKEHVAAVQGEAMVDEMTSGLKKVVKTLLGEREE